MLKYKGILPTFKRLRFNSVYFVTTTKDHLGDLSKSIDEADVDEQSAEDKDINKTRRIRRNRFDDYANALDATSNLSPKKTSNVQQTSENDSHDTGFFDDWFDN
jgi:hypothetical protein